MLALSLAPANTERPRWSKIIWRFERTPLTDGQPSAWPADKRSLVEYWTGGTVTHSAYTSNETDTHTQWRRHGPRRARPATATLGRRDPPRHADYRAEYIEIYRIYPAIQFGANYIGNVAALRCERSGLATL